jgi:peptidyl-prolyl cis-trans isomerase B (cyclophilin B)
MRGELLGVVFALALATPTAAAADETAGNPKVVLETTRGNIVIELFAARAPGTVENFLQYVDDRFYDGTIFHRVIADFMIQGGGFDRDMQKKPTRKPVRNEADNGLKNSRGTVAMARTSDPHSATAQFFINTVDNPYLNFRSQDAQGWGYAVFGRVAEGMAVVDAIAGVRTGRRGMHRDVPLEPVVIKSARRLQGS